MVPDFANPSGASIRCRIAVTFWTWRAADLLIIEDNVRLLHPRRRVHADAQVAGLRPPRDLPGSFAKTCFPGARLGYAVADQDVVDANGGTACWPRSLRRSRAC